MEANRTTNAIRGSISGLITKIVTLICPFIIRTIIIYKLGMDYAGLSSLFTSILQVLSLAELGFSSAVSYSMYKPVAEGDVDTVCALLALLRKIYHFVGIIILVAGLCLLPFLDFLIDGDYPADINLYILYGIYLSNTVVSYFISAYKSSLLLAVQRADIENNILTFVNMAMYILQIVVLIAFANYYIYIIFLPFSTIALNIFRAYVCNKKFPEYKCSGEVSKESKKIIYSNIGAMIGHRMSSVVVISISNIIISAFLGLNALAIYGNYYYVINALMAIISIIHQSLTGVIGNGIQVNSLEKNREDFYVLTFLNVWVVGWMAVCLVALYQQFIELWIGDDGLLGFGSMVLFVLYFYLWRFKDMLSTYKDACGMWKADLIKPYVVILVSLCVSLSLIKYLGINAILLGNILGVFVVSMPWETHAFFKNYLKTGEGKYYLRMLIYTIIFFLIAILNYICCDLIPYAGFGGLLIKLVISIFLPNLIIILLFFRTKEFKILFGKFKKIILRKAN